ncbi:hypothetical protein ACA910_002070 [Epithemia clementina (nom. ined.)]
MEFLPDGPYRFMSGNLLLLLGGIALQVAQVKYEVVPPVKKVDLPQQEGDDSYEQDDSETATTAKVIGIAVCAFSFMALLFYVLILRLIVVSRERDDQPNAALESGKKLYRQAGWDGLSRFFLLSPSVALFLVTVVRLFVGAENFEGDPYYLDFGWKYGLLPHNRTVDTDGNELYNEPAEKSIAFVVEFNTYAHSAQGFFSALLAFPVISSFFIRNKPSRWVFLWTVWKNIVLLAPWALSLYPSYNLVKRFAKARQAFAGSSFGNNGFEWSAGFVLGLAVGGFITAVALFLFIVRAQQDDESDSEDDGEEEEAQSNWCWNTGNNNSRNSNRHQDNNNNKPESESTNGEKVVLVQENKPFILVKMLQVLLGVVLLFTVFAASVLFADTWHGCLDDSPDDCVNYSDDGSIAGPGLQATFVAIPSVILLGASLLEFTL